MKELENELKTRNLDERIIDLSQYFDSFDYLYESAEDMGYLFDLNDDLNDKHSILSLESDERLLDLYRRNFIRNNVSFKIKLF